MLRHIVITVGAFVSAALGYTAVHLTGLTASTEGGVPGLLLAFAVLVACVGSYRSGVLAERKA